MNNTVKFSFAETPGHQLFTYRRTYKPTNEQKIGTVWCKNKEQFTQLLSQWTSKQWEYILEA